MIEFMRPLFGDMAKATIDRQKEKLHLTKAEMTYDQYLQIVEAIADLCLKMAGAAISVKVRNGLLEIVRTETSGVK
jgi:hypothetical protein